ncbi:hypothetical protein BO83DRAFT_430503 [Aspergillus eucalypticola CBS 122712]|uniref:Uncharacterized protein n=1 Tax=Aspergillus eucalypticola (strain CBS 122712 / IBT 29274) TaxID=1448314 RepID=A0A317UV59_ASPEC|nr:uncharacterized protein BO83DRAFT_430503 [Aspergillus eucalypticola CBS 122712]PWY65505.1 hypothetical protein BO83DRAFT_430503 [Aspergillus eucalypticola CBS 122712]
MSHTVGLVVQERVAPTASTPETDAKAPHPRGVEAIHRSRYPFAAETNHDANESQLVVIGFYPAFSSTAKKATVDPDLKLAPLSRLSLILSVKSSPSRHWGLGTVAGNNSSPLSGGTSPSAARYFQSVVLGTTAQDESISENTVGHGVWTWYGGCPREAKTTLRL